MPALLLFDAVYDVAVASSNAISSEVKLRRHCSKQVRPLKIPFKERRARKKKMKKKDIPLMKNLLMVHLRPSAVEPHNQSAGIQSSRCGENASSTRYKRLRVAVGTDFFFGFNYPED